MLNLQNFIFNITTDDVEGASSMNFGNVINAGAEEVHLDCGGFAPIGDLCRGIDFEQNVFVDADINFGQRIGL